MRRQLWYVVLMFVVLNGSSTLGWATQEKVPIIVEVETLRLVRAQTRDLDGASGQVVVFDAEGDRALGHLELERGVYEVTLDLLSQSEHSDAVRVALGEFEWRSFTWDYGRLTQSKPFVLTIVEKQTLPLSIEFAEPGILVDRVVIQPLLSPSVVAHMETKAAQHPDAKPATVVVEVEDLLLFETQAQDFDGASAKVVAFAAEGARAQGKVMLDCGVYEVRLDMVCQDEHHDAIYVQIGDTLGRTVSWTYSKLSQSKPFTVTILEEKAFPLTVRFAEPGVLVDRVLIKPLLNPAVIAHSQKTTDRPDLSAIQPGPPDGRPRVIVTSDGEIDDECSMVRFLLYTNEWDVEAIITSSSQYHAHGHNWAGDDWAEPYLEAYAQVYPNLVKHDPHYPPPEYLRTRTLLGNVKSEGEMEEVTAGSQAIVKVLLDTSDDRPVWIQAWGGVNTIAQALKTIEEEHPERMVEVAQKCRFFFIWEQDSTYQDYIRPSWGKYNIPTIISDQFIAIFYHWKKYVPTEKQAYLVGSWMKSHILESHGPLCSLYKAHRKTEKGFEEGDFRSEGDSPAFMHNIDTGLRSMESPDWGGWGGRYVKIRDNTWLDPVLEPGYRYPQGRWYTGSAWGRTRLKKGIPNDTELIAYLKPMWRWIDAMQNDFAARADWCVKPYNQTNHPPIVNLTHSLDMKVQPGQRVSLNAKGTADPDGNALTYRWWQYQEADTYEGTIHIANAEGRDASFLVPNDGEKGETIHVVCEVTDDGSPPLTRYRRIVVEIE